MRDTKIPYSVAMNYDSILDILVHVNSRESLRANLAARDFIDWNDNKEYNMLDYISRCYHEEIDELLPMKEFYAQHNIPRKCPRGSLAKLRVLSAFECGAKRILSLYDDVLSAYPAKTPLSDLIWRWSEHCWYSPKEDELKEAGSLRQFILNKYNCRTLTACAKERMYHSFACEDETLRVYAAYEREINEVLPAQVRNRRLTRAEELNPDLRTVNMTLAAIDETCRKIYQKHSSSIIAKMTSKDSVQRCLEDMPQLKSR